MAILSNQDIMEMSINNAVGFAKDHPAESGRISKTLLKASTTCAKVSIEYSVNKVLTPNPARVIIEVGR